MHQAGSCPWGILCGRMAQTEQGWSELLVIQTVSGHANGLASYFRHQTTAVGVKNIFRSAIKWEKTL